MGGWGTKLLEDVLLVVLLNLELVTNPKEPVLVGSQGGPGDVCSRWSRNAGIKWFG